MILTTIVLTVFVLSLCLGALLVFITLLSRHKKAGLDMLDPLGMSARVESMLEPDGSIILKGELWRARVKDLTKPIVRGSIVRIVGVSGHLLLVEPMD